MFVLGLISLPISDAFIEAHKKGVYSQTVSHVDNIIEVIPERKSAGFYSKKEWAGNGEQGIYRMRILGLFSFGLFQSLHQQINGL